MRATAAWYQERRRRGLAGAGGEHVPISDIHADDRGQLPIISLSPHPHHGQAIANTWALSSSSALSRSPSHLHSLPPCPSALVHTRCLDDGSGDALFPGSPQLRALGLRVSLGESRREEERGERGDLLCVNSSGQHVRGESRRYITVVSRGERGYCRELDMEAAPDLTVTGVLLCSCYVHISISRAYAFPSRMHVYRTERPKA
ncbi:hypothetical protein GGS23DRAFT_248563 [Durotheca rogersii]|uniref:uncharacterized protein n=1 Tax=Durotheca rogersii TaxID=419775 RepID=UPI0022204831|nr:uncharacterized protein GGS23DRAFT_248563 [Durotheca rogersii]KAI5860090.1 hypothetical protein GGS23DRAFT_248563 [Durotheca rogersii]